MPTFVVAAAPLWLAPAVLLLTAAALAAFGQRVGRPSRAGIVALGGALLVLAPSAGAAWSGGVVLSPITRLARVGSLDLTLGMVLDRASLIVGFGLLLAWIASLIASAPERNEAGRVARSLAAAAFVTAGVLADGFPLLLLALSALVLLTPIATDARGAAPARFFALAGAGVVALALGGTLLFWSLGGRWLDDARYLSDYRARFAVATDDKDAGPARPTSPNAQGSLTIVSHPGARIYDGVADEAQLLRSQPIAISPAVRVPVVAGLHKIAIAPGEGAVVAGDGLEVALVDVVKIHEGNETVIVLQGPTVTFHEIAQQLRDPAAFATRRMFSFPAASVVTASLLAALLCFALALRAPVQGSLGALAGSALFAVVALGLSRVSGVIVQSPATALPFAFLAAITATLWAVRAARAPAGARQESALGAIALLAVAAGTAAPVAPVCAMASVAFAAIFVGGDVMPEPASSKQDTKLKKKKKKSSAVDATSAPAEVAPARVGSAAGLGLAALSGAPIPGGVFVLGATGVACAFAGMGAGNALSAACIVVTWASVAAIVWRTRASTSGPQWLALVSLLAAPLAALALHPWDVPANVANDARGGLAFGGFVVASAAFFHARRPSGAASEPSGAVRESPPRLAVLLPLGRVIDRLLGAPLDLLALPFSRSAAPAKHEGKGQA